MKESIILKSIMSYLLALEKQKPLYVFRVGSGGIKTATGGYFKTGRPGVPDIVCCVEGRFIGLEVKNDKGRQSKAQVDAQNQINKSHGLYYIVRSIDDVSLIINQITKYTL